MDVLSKFFARKNDGATANPSESTREGMPLTADLLKDLIPIRNLDEEELSAFATERNAEFLPAGSVLFGPEFHDESVLYLLQGTVETRLGRYRDADVEGGTSKARFPLCSGAPQRITACAKTDVHVLRFSPDILNIGISREEEAIPSINLEQLPPRSRNSDVVSAFVQQLADGNLPLPALSSVARKLRRAIEQDVSIEKAAGIIQLDPIIATHIIRIANSPLYLPAKPITTCQDAIVRLGLPAARNLVIGLTIRPMFRGIQPFIKQTLSESWKHSVHLSSLCYVLASENPGIAPEEALLAGLVCDIGVVPFLSFCERFLPSQIVPEEINEAIPYLRGPVGALVLEKWKFPPHLVGIPVLAEDWFHDSGERLTLGDIVMLSRLHSYLGTPKIAELPPFSAIPAVRKLKDNTLSPEHSLSVLHQAKGKIAAAMKLFD